MARKTKNDSDMITAVAKTKEMMAESAKLIQVAMDEYLEHPRWGGAMPASTDALRNDGAYYPVMLNDLWLPPEAINFSQRYGRVIVPTDAESGTKFHTFQIAALTKGLEAGWSLLEHPKKEDGRQDFDKPKNIISEENPAKYLDRIREEFRYVGVLNQGNIVTVPFALFNLKKVGKPHEDTYRTIKTPGVLPMRQLYEYKFDYGRENISAILREAQDSLVAIFNHVSIALFPKELDERDTKFLKWIHSVGGKAKSGVIRSWLKSQGYGDGGIGVPSVVRKFCDKDSTKSTNPYVVRPEALKLLGLSL